MKYVLLTMDYEVPPGTKLYLSELRLTATGNAVHTNPDITKAIKFHDRGDANRLTHMEFLEPIDWEVEEVE